MLETELERIHGVCAELRRATLPDATPQLVHAKPQGSPNSSPTEKLNADLTAEKNKIQDLLQKLKEVEESKSAMMSRWETELQTQKRSLELVKIGKEKRSRLSLIPSSFLVLRQ